MEKNCETTSMPWNISELDGWSIVGMNHYHVNGKKYLFCSMAKNGLCITAEGDCESGVFSSLARKAVNSLIQGERL